ncbi:MAG TPA: sporangiospore maturation cell wall hydrolase GsmA [Natronosporangium sp.]
MLAATVAVTQQPVPAAAAGGVVASVRTQGGPLNIRGNASTWHAPVGELANGSVVRADCQLAGERIVGDARTTTLWLRLADQRFISDAFVAWRPKRPALPWCDQPADPAPGTRAGFIDWAAEYAQASQREFRVPASVSIAQSINESGWGRSSLSAQGNSFFGIKCFGTPGPIAAGCRPYDTRECDADDCFPTTGTFRVYRSAADSFQDHGRFLTVNDRYRPAFRYTDDPDRFAREIHKAGYATDPAYSDKLIALMRQYDLYRFDR